VPAREQRLRRHRHALWISDQSVYTWRRQDRIDRGLEPGLTSTEQAAARRRIAELEAELHRFCSCHHSTLPTAHAARAPYRLPAPRRGPPRDPAAPRTSASTTAGSDAPGARAASAGPSPEYRHAPRRRTHDIPGFAWPGAEPRSDAGNVDGATSGDSDGKSHTLILPSPLGRDLREQGLAGRSALYTLGAGGRRFKSGRPDHTREGAAWSGGPAAPHR
jgi:hypothetical protein